MIQVTKSELSWIKTYPEIYLVSETFSEIAVTSTTAQGHQTLPPQKAKFQRSH